MTCPHEWQLSAYADTGLDAPSVRALEAHLVGCTRCRRRVVALRDEARVLRELVHERLPAAAAPAEAGRGIAYGLPLAVAVLSLASFGAGALLETLPRPLRWFAPSESLGVTSMLVDLVFAVRNNFAAWFDFAFALAALAAVAGFAYLAADLLLRRAGSGARTAAALLVLAGAAALAPQPAQARFEVRENDHVRVAADETIEGSLVAIGDSVTIEGTVRGDLIAFGDNVRIRGVVEGNVFCGGEDVDLSAAVTGSLHCVGHDVRTSATTTGNLYAGAGDLTIEPGARVGADLAVACSNCRIQGEVARDLFAAGEHVVLEGRAGRDVSIRAAEISFRETAQYPGKLELFLPKGEEPEVATGAALGEITRKVLDDDSGATPIRRFAQADRIRSRIVLVVSAFAVGLVLFALAPGMFAVRVESTGRFFGAVGMGFVVIVLAPIVLFILLISMIGIPAALFGGLLFGALVFVGPIVVAAVVGRTVMRSNDASFRDFAVALGVGLLLLGILISLPGIGWLALAMLVLEGVGLLTFATHEWWSERRAARAAAAAA
ncbi:MAG TPA: zf-HC2 domain-containing protein [Myxococcota bacterium]